MWLMTRHGFFSIVDKGSQTHIRARERGDLERLQGFLDELDSTPTVVVETPGNDYRYRIIVKGSAVSRQDLIGGLLQRLGEDIDYPNFKAEIDNRPDQRRKPYRRVWDVMADALGAYGRRGSA